MFESKNSQPIQQGASVSQASSTQQSVFCGITLPTLAEAKHTLEVLDLTFKEPQIDKTISATLVDGGRMFMQRLFGQTTVMSSVFVGGGAAITALSLLEMSAFGLTLGAGMATVGAFAAIKSWRLANYYHDVRYGNQLSHQENNR